ncbi:MAG: hypothetical protein JNL24_06120 [Bacteroidia bacterium]|nr:hypothetical protein [Bacteroidia bacterium]
MQKKNKYFVLLLIVTLIVFISFYRDYFFRTVNAMLLAWDYEMDYPMPAHLRFFESFDYDAVLNLKWLFTLVFAAVFYFISRYTIQYLFSNRNYNRIVLFAFAGLTVLSGLFMIIGWMVPSSLERMYEIARFLMGLAQSPVVLMVLIPAFMLAEKEVN